MRNYIKGSVLKTVTKILGYTQKELAEMMDIGDSTVSRVFLEETTPTKDFIDKFIEATGMPLKFLENFESELAKIGKQYNFQNGSVGNLAEVQTVNLNQTDADVLVNLGREKEILLIKSHILELEKIKVFSKDTSENKIIDKQIAEKHKEINQIESKISK